MSKIILFKHANFGNPSLTVTEATSDLTATEMANHVSSCTVESGTWILYTGKDYSNGGAGIDHRPSILHGGDHYSSPAEMKLKNDHVTSLRPLPDKGICLFENSIYNGRMVHLDEGAPPSNLDFRARSVIVQSGEWSLFTDSDFGGDRCSAPIGKFPNQPAAFSGKTIATVKPAAKGNLVLVSRPTSAVTGSGPKLELMDTPCVELIVDTSGSMGSGSSSLMEQAKTALKDLMDDLPDGIKVALRIFGSNNQNSGTKTYGSGYTTLIQPLQPLNKADLKTKVDGLTANGNTPIYGSLVEAKKDLTGVSGSKVVVLITDGYENCGGAGTIVDAIRDLRALDTDLQADSDDVDVLTMNVVGFSISADWMKVKFKDWATEGGGAYADAQNADELYTNTKEALSIPYKVLLNYENQGEGYVDGGAVELEPNAGYAIMLDFKLANGSSPRPITNVRIEAGKTTEIPIVRW